MFDARNRELGRGTQKNLWLHLNAEPLRIKRRR